MIIAIVTFLYSFYTSFLRLLVFATLMQWLALLLSFLQIGLPTPNRLFTFGMLMMIKIIRTLQNAAQRL